jgi:hypothetical protein
VQKLIKTDLSGVPEAAEYLGVSPDVLTTKLLPRFQLMQQIELLTLFADIVAQ